jgi:DNA invertase Pin-like site-specific DNA recombinase
MKVKDESLAKVMAELETKIGKERLSALRREAAKRGISVLSLLGDAVSEYVSNLTGEEAA